MARRAVVEKVKEVLADQWTAAPITDENVAGVTPADASSFLLVQYPYANSRQITIGAPGDNLWRDEGAFRIVIHVERGAGADQAREWADELAAIFRGKNFDVFTIGAPTAPVTDDRNAEGAYYLLSLAVPYRHDYYG